MFEKPPNSLPPDRVRLDFGQRRLAQTVLPLLTSVMVHIAVLLLGTVFFYGIRYVVHQAVHEEQVTIPQTVVMNDGPPGGVPFQGLGNDPTRLAAQDQVKEVTDPEWAPSKGTTLHIQLPGGGEGDSSDPIIGLGPGGNTGLGKRGHGIGAGDQSGAGGGEGGPLSRFGAPGGGGFGARNPIFGPNGDARRIDFVCDASGSMLNKFATLRRELTKTVQQLRPVQSFNIVFFQEQDKMPLSKDGEIMATPENKVKAQNFLEERVTPKGETNPIPGLIQAFQDKPDLIYLLTDGDFPDNDAVLKKIRELEKTHKVKINTIAFVSAADTDTAFMKLLKQIADETKGDYRYVKESQVGG